ncbi:beta-1,3-galactosyltransferase 4-like isoform X2 [Dermacentor albipictus]|uniref:beta-1,3-galactosyltransferase 4-like isoform X2 n=1 Tax=Dermacentor albipictus TaxID=60249 RepID=UPI0038FBF448
MSKLLIILLRRVTIAVWLSFTSLLIYFLLARRSRVDTTWSQPPPAAATAAAANLRLLASASGGAFGTLPRASCPSFLAVVVCSAPDHAPERQAIRDTWARDARPGHSAVYFLLGRSISSVQSDDSSVLPESSVFGDVIRADFEDTIRNQTLKSLLLLQWAHTFCPRVSFVLKADDDAYVDLPGLVGLLEAKKAAFENDTRRGNSAGFLLGKRHESRPIGRKRRRHYGSPAGSWVPVYLSGAAYVMSGAIVGPMLRKALETPALHHENVFLTGIVASKLHLRLFNSPCFACCDELADPCAYRGLLAATVAKPDTLRTAWALARGQTAGACTPLNGTDRHC